MSCRTSSHFLSSNKAPKTTNGQGKRSLFCMMKRVWKSRWISTHNFFFTWISSWINSGSIPTSKSGLHYFLKEPVHANRVFFFFFEVSEGPSIPGISEPERSVVVRSDRRVFWDPRIQKMPIVQKVTVTNTVFWGWSQAMKWCKKWPHKIK